ncbi:MAG: hypothetical protein LBI16_00955 [Burkholderiales bacterium]|nr:hypothetical protein [Burkholderiales bacterium]
MNGNSFVTAAKPPKHTQPPISLNRARKKQILPWFLLGFAIPQKQRIPLHYLTCFHDIERNLKDRDNKRLSFSEYLLIS